MHEQRFPESTESPDARTARALKALELEDSAGRGRRPDSPAAPWGMWEDYRADADDSTAQLVGGYFAASGVVFGLVSLAVMPLLFAFLAFVGITFGTILGGRNQQKLNFIAMIVASACFLVGMSFALAMERPVFPF